MPKSSKAATAEKPRNLAAVIKTSLAPQKRNLPWLLLAALVLGLDLLTKAWVSQQLVLYQRLEVLPVFELTLMHNSGAAFSFLATAGGWQRWFFVIVALVASLAIWIWLNKLSSQQKLTALSLALILGGALGNLHDRFLYGYVVDFLAFHWQAYYFPAFNIADVGITLGAAGLILEAWRERHD